MGLEVTCKEIRPQKFDEYVKKKMQDWEANTAPQMEQITQGWHPMYHILQYHASTKCLPQFPWTHNKKEVKNIVAIIYNMKISKQIW